MEGKQICMCECHVDGIKVMHCVACCELTYKKYIDKNGNVDIQRLSDLREEAEKIAADVFNPAESNLEYFLRRRRELGVK